MYAARRQVRTSLRLTPAPMWCGRSVLLVRVAATSCLVGTTDPRFAVEARSTCLNILEPLLFFRTATKVAPERRLRSALDRQVLRGQDSTPSLWRHLDPSCICLTRTWPFTSWERCLAAVPRLHPTWRNWAKRHSTPSLRKPSATRSSTPRRPGCSGGSSNASSSVPR